MRSTGGGRRATRRGMRGRDRRGRKGNDLDGDLHAGEAQAIAADEVIVSGSSQGDEILAGAPISGDPIHRAVVVTRPVHLEHVVRVLLVPESCRFLLGLGCSPFRC